MGATGQRKLSNWSAPGQIRYVICGSNWSAKTSWSLAEPTGSSDHLPILIELNYVKSDISLLSQELLHGLKTA